MRKLLAVLVLLLLVCLSLGCLNRAEDSVPSTTSAASTVLQLSTQPSINQSEYVAFACQLNVSRGSGLNGKEIHWFVDNVQKDPSLTQWGYASLNLSAADTQELSTGKHVLKASFDGDPDYSPSNATAVFQVQTAPTPTPTPTPSASPSPSAEPESRSITLSIQSPAKPGSIGVSGTHSGLKNGENIYVLVKPQDDNTWRVQNLPLVYVNGTFSASMNIDKPASYDVLALITGSQLDAGATLTKLPSSAAESRTTITVQ